jgi:hypothetical protein
MTIASFCRDELLAHGPLTLDELTTRAVAAEVTRSANPTSSVRQAIQYGELELADGRWATPLQLLEGRCLTTPSLAGDYWGGDEISTSDLDLALLRLAVRDRPIPVAGGGKLAAERYGGSWDVPDSFPDPAPGELLCLRVEAGGLTVTTVALDETESPAARRFVVALNRAVPRSSSWRDRSTSEAIADLLATDEAYLREPAPPLSWCCDALREEVSSREARRRAQELERWRPVSYVDDRGLVTMRLTPQQAEVVRQLGAAAADALPSRGAEERWEPGPDHLRLLR